MLPFDNKSRVPGRRRHAGRHAARETRPRCCTTWARIVATMPEVTDYQAYAGTAAPINFNGLVRQYYLRAGAELGDLQVNLVDKHHRERQSHAIAARLRPELERSARAHGARVKVVEVPPGPPVLSPIVAEIYGPDDAGRHAGRAAHRAHAFRAQRRTSSASTTAIEASAPRCVVRVDQARTAALGRRAGATSSRRVRAALDGRRRDDPARRARSTRCRCACSCRRARRSSSTRCWRCTGRGADGTSGAAVRSGAGRAQREREQTRLPQGPAAGELRRRRHAGQARQPALRHVRHPRACSRGGPARHGGTLAEYFIRQPDRSLPRLRAQVGRRMAGHLRDVPRHGHRLRGRPGADLPAGRRAVRLVPDAAHHHGADPADDHRRDARPRAAAARSSPRRR